MSIEPLEGRDVPAGNVTATLGANGVLTLTGDDQANGISAIAITPAGVTITPDANTQVNGQGNGNPVQLVGQATSLTAKLAGGADQVQIDAVASFVLSGLASFDLGGGDDTLSLSTTGKIQLGGLVVTGGDGDDTVTVQGGTGRASSIGGTPTFDLGPGAAVLNLGANAGGFGELAVPKGGVRVTSGAGTSLVVNAATLTTAGPVTVSGRPDTTTVNVSASNLGGLTVTGVDVTAALTTSRVNGSVSATGSTAGVVDFTGVAADLQLVTGDVTATGQAGAVVSVGTSLQARSLRATATAPQPVGATISAAGQFLTISGGVTAYGALAASVDITTAGPAQIGGDVVASSGGSSEVTLGDQGDGPVQARGVTVRAPLAAVGKADFTALGAALTLGGGLTVAGGSFGTSVDIDTVGLAQVAGDVAVSGTGNITVGLGNTGNGGAFQARSVAVTHWGAGSGATLVGAGGSAFTLQGGLAVAGGAIANVSIDTPDPSQLGGDLTVTSGGISQVSLSGDTFRARSLTVSAPTGFGSAGVVADGQSLTLVNGLAVTGRSAAAIDLNTTDPTQVGGGVTAYSAGGGADVSVDGGGLVAQLVRVTGLPAGSTFTATGNLKLSGGLTVTGGGESFTRVTVGNAAPSTIGGGVSVTTPGGPINVGLSSQLSVAGGVNISVGDATGPVVLGDGGPFRVGGGLTVAGRDGNVALTLDGLALGGAADIRLGGGNDSLSIEHGATFARTFYADLGTGDDLISIAQATGATGPVAFVGKATLLAAAGNDTLKLGLAQGAPNNGDANSRVAFAVAGNVIDGGSGLNLYDDEAGQFAGPVSIFNWSDPTPP